MSIGNDRYEYTGPRCESCRIPLEDGEGWTYCHGCDAWTCGNCEHEGHDD